MPISDFKLDTGLQVSGSATFTSSVSSSGGFTGSLAGTSSYGQDANLLDGLDSSAFALTGSVNYFKVDQIVSGNLNVTASLTASSLTASDLNIDYIDFVTGLANPAHQRGRIFWDDANDTLAMYNTNADVTQQLGQEFFIKVINKSGNPILNGTPVKISGATGDRPNIWPAQSVDQSTDFSRTYYNEIIGLATHDIPDNETGSVTLFGLVNDVPIDTNWNLGDSLYLSRSAGLITNITPEPPYDNTLVGFLTKKNGGSGFGSIFVYTQPPKHFSDISSVSASTYLQGDLWMYKTLDGSGVWINTKQLSSSAGYAITGSLNVTNNISASTITGSFSGLMNGVAAVAAGTNLTSSLAGGSLVLNLTSSITSGLNNISGSNLSITALTVTGSTGLSGALGTFNTLTSSNDALVNNIRVGRGAGNISTNVVLGVNSLASNTTGYGNLAIGNNTLSSNTTGVLNIAIGSGAGFYSTGPNGAILIGQDAGPRINSNGTIAIGAGTLQYHSQSGNLYNFAVGTNALKHFRDGYANYIFGFNGGYSLGKGDNNVVVGSGCLTSLVEGPFSTGSSNVAIGNGVLASLVNANHNIGIGNSVLIANLIGSSNVGIGQAALYTNTTGSNNTAIGKETLVANKTGDNSTAIGVSSLQRLENGSNNLGVGSFAGYNLLTGSNNVYIGSYRGVNDVNNNIYLSDGSANLRLQINDSGLVDIPGALTVSGNVTLGDNSADTVKINANTISLNGALNIDSNTLYINDTTNKVGIGTNSVATSALVEMSGTNLGLLFPRVSGSARATMTGATGLIVYQTDTSGSDAEGLYIYKSSGWIQII